ncbi:MAG: hypothetical protein A3F83_05985 [Candidatus Glassbacteria bacterium RIFCSPLOWO2_12_FULL_58_11]|uniref:SGNH hydrolase-type esterase domain-containing protein n=1 Tax=Candidatus Glassbacteria bacterium RIFCSPLOWO2_12_FULL_58_11 TaxID=1817867 RepID=A0A1F5YST4_9BACT|nr:MAG: hypothetical protein A3F83_05985 [Candidatus Glassbacteria bacterium RIFCSPLOWO2_12_FULL_58_11]
MFSKIKPESIYRILIVGGSSAESVITGDEDSWYYLLLESLDSDSLLKGKIEVINAGVSGNNSKLINEQLQKQGFELKPDLILYYEAHNDIHLVTPWFKHLDTKIGLLAKSHLIHRLLHYRSMLYTYLVEKYFFTKMKITQWRIDEKLTSENFKSIITNCKKRSIDFVYIRQANNFPLEKDGKNLTDEHDLRELIKIYSEKKTIGEDKTRLSEEWSELMVFLQRLLLVIQTKICWLENIEVIDPLPAFEAARKDSLVLFQGHGNKTNFGVHTTCEGDKILAKCVFDGIKQKVENGVSYFAVK